MSKIAWDKGSEIRGQSLAENVAFLMVAVFVSWILEKLTSWVFAPFRWTAGSTMEMVRADWARKVEARAARLDAYDRDTRDPMHQFQERFIKNPGKWDGDPDNAAYLHWYGEWKAGRVLDTQLRWAPNVTSVSECDDINIELDTALKETVSGNFINYLAIQLDLHMAAPAWRRHAFLKTVSRFYPELQPTVAGLTEDIAAYGSEAAEAESERDLVRMFKENGIPEDAWGYLRTVPAKQLKAKMEYLRNCAAQECDPEVALAICEAGLPYDSNSDKLATDIVKGLNLPGKALSLYVRKKLTADEIAGLGKRIGEFIETFGDSVWEHRDGTPDGVCFRDEMFDQYLKELDASKRARKADRLCAKSTVRR